MAAAAQPARKSYFFEKGYQDIAATIKGAWTRNGASIQRYRDYLNGLGDKGVTARVFLAIANILAMAAVVVCGSLITAAITLVNVLVLVVFMAVLYLGFTAIWAVDRLYLVHKRIFTACHECKKKSLIPTYLCPRCGAKHTNLTPGVYGILRRTCSCGEKLPTTFFNGRKNLEAECPRCGHRLADRESRPLCIPVVGGRSVGKTAYITAFSKEFLETVAPQKGLETEFYNDRKERIYQEIVQDFQTGNTRITDRPQDVKLASAVSFSFFVKHASLSPERLIHVYDIAGEVFTNNDENEVQQQYEYCQGIVFILDPFAIPEVRFQYEELLSPEDLAGIGRADLNDVIDSFLNKLREVTGLSDSSMSTVPLAVVISKIDSAGLDQDVGRRAVEKLMKAQPQVFTDFFNTQDYLCRKFLRENGMESFLNNISLQFKNNRFFACSAIGHSRGKGPYRPEGVLPPMEWLIQNADPKLGQLWGEHVFPKKPISAGPAQY